MRYACVLLSLGAAVFRLHAQQDQTNREPVWRDTIQKATDAQANGRFAEAEQLMQTAWAEVQLAGAADERFPAGVQEVVNYYNSTGQGLKVERILHAAETAVAKFPAAHFNRLSILTLKAQTYDGEGRAVEAQALYEQLLPIQQKVFGPDSFEVRNTLQTLASSYEGSGELEKGEALFARLDSMSTTPAPSAFFGNVMMISGRNIMAANRFGFAMQGRVSFRSTQLGDFYDWHGRWADAEKAYQASIARGERDGVQGLESALTGYQHYLRNRHRYADAEQVQFRIMKLHQNSAEPADANREVFDQNLADLYLEAEQFDKANKVYEEARADILASKGSDSNEYRNVQQSYAYALLREGKLDEATKVAEELAQGAPLEANDYTRENALQLLAQIRDQSGDHGGAEAYRAQAMAIQENPSNDLDVEGVGADVRSAQASLNKGEVNQAWPRIEHAIAVAETAAEPFKTVNFLQQVANLVSAFGDKDIEKADEMMRRIGAIQDRALSPTHPMYNRWFIANYYRNRGRLQDAERMWNAHLLAIENANGPESTRLVDPLMQIAHLLSQQSRFQEAVATVQRVLSIHEKTRGPNSDEVLNLLALLAQFYLNFEGPQRAMECYERQIRISSKTHGGTLNHSQVLTNVAVVYLQHQQFDRAIELASEAVEIASRPENDIHAGDYFRSVLDSARQQKAAAAIGSNAPSAKWFNVDRFSRPNATRLGSAATPML
jgi:tetratricopeptide (TPR) repeat protein